MNIDYNPLTVPAHRHTNPDGTEGGWVADSATVAPTAYIGSNALVSGNARVAGNARVSGNAWVSGNARVYGNAWVDGNAWVYGNAWVAGNAWVSGNARVAGNARVSEPRHTLTIGPIGSEDQYVTLARTGTGHTLTIGCWHDGTIDALKAEVMRRAPECWPEYKSVRALLRLRVVEWDAARTEATA